MVTFFVNHPWLMKKPAAQVALWKALACTNARLRELQSARTVHETNDWLTAVRIVQRFYPGSDSWLVSCSGSEGGHGVFVYHGGRAASADEIRRNVEYSTPGGQMQYFPGTFWSDFNAAVQDLARRHIKVPRSAWTWYSPLGQALAGGYAHNLGHYTGGKWTGRGC